MAEASHLKFIFIDFVDTAPTVRNFIRRSKLISSFKKKEYKKEVVLLF